MGERGKPIIFSAPMVRALLAGTKTQTRRTIKPRGKSRPSIFDGTWTDDYVMDPGNAEWRARDLAYAVGDRLWVREALERANGEAVGYPADGTWLPNTPWIWKRSKLPSIHMPRAFSRLTLIVTDVRVQRLQEITSADAIAEGCTPYANSATIDCGTPDPRDDYRALWDRINGPGAWEANPWVAAYSFTVHRANIAALSLANAEAK